MTRPKVLLVDDTDATLPMMEDSLKLILVTGRGVPARRSGAKQVLSLPFYPELSSQTVAQVAAVVGRVAAKPTAVTR
jgi:hypothetical protein